MIADCVTLWIGDSLGPVERACLRSVARHHPVALYCYNEPAGVPREVELRDASAVLPYEKISGQWCDRADLYSDWFRYELLRRGLGTWVDADVYLLSPLDMQRPYLFGWEEPGVLNNAVFRLPPDSPLLPKFLEPFHKRTTPKYLPRSQYIRMRIREFLIGKPDLRGIPWGTTSPWALTGLAREFGVEYFAEPVDRFYPVPWERADWILDPELRLEDMITSASVAVHLWNRCIEHYKNKPAPPGSFLARLHEEGGA